jgi:DNA-binding cell septation regulator SpoVG
MNIMETETSAETESVQPFPAAQPDSREGQPDPPPVDSDEAGPWPDEYDDSPLPSKLTNRSVTDPSSISEKTFLYDHDDIRGVTVNPYVSDSLRGFADVTLWGHFTISGISILERQYGLWVSMPARQVDGNWEDVVHPVTKSLKEAISDCVLDAYDKTISGLSGTDEPPTSDPIGTQPEEVGPYPPEPLWITWPRWLVDGVTSIIGTGPTEDRTDPKDEKSGEAADAPDPAPLERSTDSPESKSGFPGSPHRKVWGKPRLAQDEPPFRTPSIPPPVKNTDNQSDDPPEREERVSYE